jgi:hypothetical protein
MAVVLVNTSSAASVYVSFDTNAAVGRGTLIRPYGTILFGGYTLLPWNGVATAVARGDTVILARTQIFSPIMLRAEGSERTK